MRRFDREEGAFRVGDALPFGRLTDQALAVIREGDDRRRRARAFGVLDHFRGSALHDRNTRIRRAEVDADDLAHALNPLCQLRQAGRTGLASGGERRGGRHNAPPKPSRPPIVQGLPRPSGIDFAYKRGGFCPQGRRSRICARGDLLCSVAMAARQRPLAGAPCLRRSRAGHRDSMLKPPLGSYPLRSQPSPARRRTGG